MCGKSSIRGPSPLQQNITNDIINNPRPKKPNPRPPTRNQAIKAATEIASAYRTGNLAGVKKNIGIVVDYYWEEKPMGE